MAAKEITVSITITRDDLCSAKKNPASNEMLAAQIIFDKLRTRGVPVIGVLGILAVEWGKLTIEHEDGLDGDEWKWTWTGKPMPLEWVMKCAQPGRVLRLDYPLAQQIADADEL